MLKEEGVKPPSQVLSTNLVTRDDIIAQKNYLHWIFADVSWAATSYPLEYIRTPPPFFILFISFSFSFLLPLISSPEDLC